MKSKGLPEIVPDGGILLTPCVPYGTEELSLLMMITILSTNQVANYVLTTMYVLCLTEQITLSYCTTQQDDSYRNFS